MIKLPLRCQKCGRRWTEHLEPGILVAAFSARLKHIVCVGCGYRPRSNAKLQIVIVVGGKKGTR